MKHFFSLLVVVVLFGNLFAQDKWVPDYLHTAKPLLGKYVTLPTVKTVWENPNRETRIIMTPAGVLAITPNIRVLPNSNQQDEVILSSNPAFPLVLFGSANTTVGSAYGQGCYVSTNGGLNWYGTDLMPNMPSSTSDPAPAVDKNGVLVFTTLNTVGTAYMIGSYSTNFGVNWSTPYTIYSSSSDKNMTGTDDVSSSPYYGRTYTVWSKWSSPYPIMISYTTNSGVSWSTAMQINSSPSGLSQGCDVVVGLGGAVYVCWSAQSGTVSDYVGFARSTNGGANFTVTENAFDVNGMRSSSFNGWGVRVNDFPRIAVDKSSGPRNGWIYIVDCEQNLSPAGSDPDIILHRSTNGGVNWSGGIRVNQDALNNGKIQFFPAVSVDEYGGVNVVYYDNRNYPSYGDSCETYVSRSLDGGTTFTDIKVSDHAWKPKPEPGMGTYMGDYIGITSVNGKVWPFWTDDKSGSFQAWTCSIELGPSISHTQLGNTEQISGVRAVNCTITPAGSNIDPTKTRLFYSKNNPSFTDSVLMTNSSGNNWSGNITLSGAGLYRYYIKTTDLLNRTATSPPGAPSASYSFIASTDTTRPIITHVPIADVPKNTWPANVSATVTDNIGIDSVWVRWYKNNTGTGIKHFKLINTSGNAYSANFNSDTSQVNFNDSIFYRIFARDNSSLHNIDSTPMYKFKIIAQTTATIGTGTTANGWPFYTFYMDSRTDMLYTASEILSGGGARGYIAKIGFDVVSNATQVMNGFNVKMQNYTDASLTGFVSTGWTVPYSGTYTVPGTGWQYINLTTPFYWNGTSNLLIEICFDNNSYTSNTTVNSTANSLNQNKHQHSDLSSGSGCVDITSPGSSYTARPNIKLVINMVTGSEEQIITSIPDRFALSQNYPNPFNPVTRINFDIPKQGFVTLKIFDVLGREVKILVNEVRDAGRYYMDFNGEEFSSGVYFYKLQSGDFSDTKRMMLIK